MQTFAKPTIISPAQAQAPKKKSGKIWLIIAGIFFILMFVPDPGKFIPVFGEGEELAEGGISLSALLIYVFRYWLYYKIKEEFTRK